MGKKYVIDETTLTNIADVIREVEQDSMVKIDPVDMPGRIGDVCNKAYNDGKSDGEIEGYNKGHTDGYNEGHTAGKQSGYDNCMLLWWDAMTEKGKRISCIGTFMNSNVGDIEGIEKIPYPLKLTGQCDSMFKSYWGRKLLPKKLLDLTEIKKTYDNAVVISAIFSNWTSARAGTTEGIIPDYGIPAMSYYTQFCYGSSAVGTIEIIRCHEKTQFSQSFNGTTNLKNIIFDGVIGQNISFSSSPLTVESILSVITHLKDYSADETNAGKYTITLKDSCKTLMAEQGAIAELGGKTYDQYITDIGWNLA